MDKTVATASRIPHLSTQDSSHSRSQTEPLIQSPERLHKPRLSFDASPRHLALERDSSPSPILPSKQPRKRRRSTTTTSIPPRQVHSRKGSGLAKSPSVPTFQIKSDPRDSISALPLPAPEFLPPTPATPLLRVPSNASTADSRSPPQRRAPASHSSYGVETSNGPPPSFTTQRTLSQDRLWKPVPPEKSNVPKKMDGGPANEEFELSHVTVNELVQDWEVDSDHENLEAAGTPRKEVDGSIEGPKLNPDAVMAGDSTETLCTGGELLTRGLDMPSADEGSKNSGSDDRKSEDMFLNIAKADAGGQELITRSERRKSRIGTFRTASSTRPNNGLQSDATSPPEQEYVNDGTLSPETEVPYQPHKRHSFGPRSIAASAHPLDDSGRHRYFSSGTRIRTTSTVGMGDHEASPEPLQNSNNRATNLDSGNRSYRRSNLSAFRTDRNTSTAEAQERPRYIDHNPTRIEGTDSTLSTTAPSTLWDELDELKSRIRKLELTGKLPSSSAAAMSSAERPHTATTTVTTVSSSPKHGKASTSPIEPAIDGVSPTVHPLLHEALRKARPTLSTDVYQKLESTASDALQLASMMGGGLQSGNASVIGAASSAERQLRRRADSMCRGLTELTIALSARPRSPTLLQPFRPSSRDASSNFAQTPPTTSYSVDSAARFGRRFSNEPDDTLQSVTARVHSRLETRRASLLHNSIVSSPHEYASSVVAGHTPSSAHSQNQMQPTSSSRLNRAASRLRSRRTQAPVDGADDSEVDNSPSVRPVSRARTEVSLRHRSARDRTSLGREYTSSHPLPSFVRKGSDSATQISPSVIPSSGLPTRRPYAASNVNGGRSNLNSPATPSHSVQPDYRRYVSSGAARESPAYLSSTEHTPENVTVQRGNASGSRRSLGLTSRLGQMGSFVNGRLRAAKAERERQEALQEQQKAIVLRVTPQESGDDQENRSLY